MGFRVGSGENVTGVGKKATSCGEKVENWRKKKIHCGATTAE